MSYYFTITVMLKYIAQCNLVLIINKWLVSKLESAWYQLIHVHVTLYGMVSMHFTLWYGMYQYMSHYGMIPIHVILWHGTNTCHTMAWYQCMSHYQLQSMSHYMAWYQSCVCVCVCVYVCICVSVCKTYLHDCVYM